MRHMDRRYRPDIADELEFSRENLLHDQITFARERLGVITREMNQLAAAPTLKDVRQLIAERVRATKNRTLANRAKRESEIGALKALLKDDLLRERNTYARKVMAEIEGRQKESEQ